MTSRWFVADDEVLINLDSVEDIEKQESGVRVIYTSGRTRWLTSPDAFSRLRTRLFWYRPGDDSPPVLSGATEWEG